MKEIDKEESETKWKVEDAIRSFTEYKRLTRDKKVKEKVAEELKKRAEDYKKLSEQL